MIEYLVVLIICLAGPGAVALYDMQPAYAYLLGFILGTICNWVQRLRYDSNKEG